MKTLEERLAIDAMKEEIDLLKAQKENLHLRLEIAFDERNLARTKMETLFKALRSILRELGVPQPDYPAPITNAVHIARAALKALKAIEG